MTESTEPTIQAAADEPDKHCETCVCNSPHSLEHFNRRCAKLAVEVCDSVLKSAVLEGRLAPEIAQRIRYRSWPDTARIFFTGWKLSHCTASVAGQLLAYVEPDERYPDQHKSLRRHFAATMVYIPENWIGPWLASGAPPVDPEGRLLAVQPFAVEYRVGDMFDISGSPYNDQIELMMDWTDSALSGYFRLHAEALVVKIVESIRARTQLVPNTELGGRSST